MRKKPAIKSWRQDRVSPWTYPLLVVLLVPFLFPLAWMLLSSLKTQVENTAYPPIWVFKPTLANYREVFIKNPFFTFAWNSLVVAAGSTGLALLLGLPGAYAIARFKRTGIALALVNIAAGLTGRLVKGLIARSSVSFALIWAGILFPLGFFLGGIVTYGGDPGLGIWLVPVAALLLFYSVLRFARDLSKLR